MKKTPIKLKRYTLFKFPSPGGSPKEFSTMALMKYHVRKYKGPPVVFEYRDNKLNQYFTYWKSK